MGTETIVRIELTDEQVANIKASLEERNLFETSEQLRENNIFENAFVSAPIPATNADIFIDGEFSGDHKRVTVGIRCKW